MLKKRRTLSADEHGFSVSGPFEDLREFIPRRRADIVKLWPFLETETSTAMCDEMLERFVPEMVGTSTFETPFRNIPFATPIAEFDKLGEVLDEALPHVYAWILKNMRPGIQAYPRDSRLGWPILSVVDDKIAALQPVIQAFLEGDVMDMTDAFVQVNIRLQASDPPGKERNYFFINAEGEIFESTVRFEDRYDPETKRTASRTRLVFNYPLLNLITQCADNAFQRAMLRFPMFHRDMQGIVRSKWRSKGTCVAFDFKHFERVTSYVALKWMRIVGGRYGAIMEEMFWLPFLVPAIGEGRRNFTPFLVRPTQGKMMPQLGSGLSLVSPIQKIAMLCVYSYYFTRKLNKSYEYVIDELAHQRGSVRIWNQGDDNFLEFDSVSDIDPLYAYLKSILPVEVEEPTAFLKFVYYPLVGFRLMGRSFVLNTTNNERQPGSRFRPFPYWGWREKKRHFTELGESIVAAEMIPAFNAMYANYGVTQEFLALQAARDYANIRASGDLGLANWKVATEKTYLLTDQEKQNMPGQYAVLDETVTTKIVEKLLEAR